MAPEPLIKIARIDVSQQMAGREIAFDRLYIARGMGKQHLKRTFPYALVMPYSDDVRQVLLKAHKLTVRDFPQGGRSTAPTAIAAGDALAEFDNDCIVVVPILSAYARRRLPTYLVNARWVRGAVSKRRRGGRTPTKAVLPKHPLPMLSYLQTPDKNYRPVCIACPRFVEHQAGLCELGMRVCYESLLLGSAEPAVDDNAGLPPADIREVLNAP